MIEYLLFYHWNLNCNFFFGCLKEKQFAGGVCTQYSLIKQDISHKCSTVSTEGFIKKNSLALNSNPHYLSTQQM